MFGSQHKLTKASLTFQCALCSRKQQHPGFFKDVKCEITRHCRKSRQKLFQAVSSFQIVEQGLDGHPCAPKDRRTMQDLRVLDDGLTHISIVTQSGT